VISARKCFTSPGRAGRFLLKHVHISGKISQETRSLAELLVERRYMAILKLDKHNEDKEIQFELHYLASLTTQQWVELIFRKTQEMLSLRKKRNAHRTVTEIIKRKPR
jgi:hypothetical protein